MSSITKCFVTMTTEAKNATGIFPLQCQFFNVYQNRILSSWTNFGLIAKYMGIASGS